MAGYTEEQYELSRAEQNSGGNAPELKPTANPAPGTLEAYEQQQGAATTRPVAVSTTDNRQSASAPISARQQRVDATAGIDRQIKTVRDWMSAEGNRPETPEERKKRERREKSKKIIAAVSDGISALGNLYYTSQYAPNMYNHEKESMMKPVNARIERMKAEREKNADKYMQFAFKLGDLERERAKTLRELEAQQESRKRAREKAQREVELHGWLADMQSDKRREQKGRADKAEQEAITAKAIAEYAPQMQRKKVAVEDAKAAHWASVGGKKHHFRGKQYLSEKDYTKDVTEAARQYNARHKDEEGFEPIIIEREERTTAGKRIVARKPEEYAGEVESRLEQEAADNRPPSRRNNDNRPPSRQ